MTSASGSTPSRTTDRDTGIRIPDVRLLLDGSVTPQSMVRFEVFEEPTGELDVPPKTRTGSNAS